MTNLHDYLRSYESEMVILLRALVSLESPSSNKAAVDAVGDVISGELAALGADVRVVAQTGVGNHIVGVINAGRGSPIAMFCHMDTVHPVGSLASMPVKVEDGRLWGPGSFDMKASHVIALYAVRALRDLGAMPDREIRLVFTSDEEIGSTSSRDLIESTARDCTLAMVMEPALSDGRLKSSRKGVGDFKVTARGRAAHAGADHAKGINAILELAHQVQRIQALTDYERGVTFNVGWMQGGGATNVVPDKAELIVDTRCERLTDAEWVKEQLYALQPVVAGASLSIEGDWNRPPMECDAERLAVFARIKVIGDAIGVSVGHGPSGGGSDASFTAAIGVPTMDGFGAVGDGLHAPHEHILVASLAERAALSAAVLAGW